MEMQTISPVTRKCSNVYTITLVFGDQKVTEVKEQRPKIFLKIKHSLGLCGQGLCGHCQLVSSFIESFHNTTQEVTHVHAKGDQQDATSSSAVRGRVDEINMGMLLLSHGSLAGRFSSHNDNYNEDTQEILDFPTARMNMG